MRIALASYGTRGDIEPSVAVGQELLRRGHEVKMAVPPDLVGFAEKAGLQVVEYGPAVEPQLDGYRDLWTSWAKHFWHVQELVALCREALGTVTQQWAELSRTLLEFADGADVLSTAVGYEQPAANVAEYYGIPLVTLHTMPWRPNGQLFPLVPAPVTRAGMIAYDWLAWRLTRKYEDAQRAELGLPPGTGPAPVRMAQRGALEIQAYDEVCVPGLAAEWSKRNDRRPFVGALTLQLATGADEEIENWIAAGSAPVCFAFGSIPVESPTETVAMISGACAELGERALICAGGTDLSGIPVPDHVKVAGVVNYAKVFSASRAAVHHGGSGTTAASLRCGTPTLILWSVGDQPLWGNQLKRLKVGTARSISTTTTETLVADLRRILTPQYAARARALAADMTPPADSIMKAADLIEGLPSR
ncbi:glycosyl transferase family 1 [Mycobacterium sp. GA-1841]|uniref:glycosyltransferase n=1 Tax=Mycobacterium sp. GA-1841 TaxID=1834154 RepID=UPI00096C06C0|nr:glycosyltransferase [Mycobacterium sp. GA-1841]OMC34093.1 glycosyl transferase family 1 [Mycobacterium sp. GA-1841]